MRTPEVADSIEKKIDLIFQVQRSQLQNVKVSDSTLQTAARLLWNKKLLLIAIPLLFVIFLIVYMVVALYPTAVFAWGDYEERFNHIVERRRTVWIAVIVALFINVLSTLFTLGLADLLS